MTLLLLFLGVLTLCNAHHIITNIHINNVDQGAGTCVRVPPNTNPVVNVKATEMACNVGGEKALDKFCPIDAGAVVTTQWRTWPDGSVETLIDVSHQGPCSVYMKKVNAFGDRAAGEGWFKIWHFGFEDGEFCTEKLRRNGGMMNVTIPRDLQGGRYLLRAEHLALHQTQNVGGAQWYIGCIQVVIYSTGGSATPSGVSIPGHVHANDPSVLFNYWNNMHPKSYVIPGPAPYVPTNTGGGQRVKAEYSKKYPECLVTNADWCAVSVPSFKDESSCWASSKNCWEQLNTCYNTAPATGHTGCTTWEADCESYNKFCQVCGDTRSCSGSFPSLPSANGPRTRAEHRGLLLPPILKRNVVKTSLIHSPHKRTHKRTLHKHTRRDATADSTPTSGDDKLTKARALCDGIASRCKEDGIGGLCNVFGAACRSAVTPSVVEQFPEKSDRKWQALWLYQTACENENFDKDECRERFSKAVWGFK